MKSLKIIQTLAKIGKIISNIIFICCIVGACICAVGIISMVLMGNHPVQVGDVSIHGLIESESITSTPVMYAYLAVTMVACIAEAIVSKFAVSYFKNELADGTPFTTKGAKELLCLGILSAALSIVVPVVAGIGFAVASHFSPGLQEFDMESGSSMGTGIAMIILSLFCRYGAELTEKTGAAVENAVPAVEEEVPETEPEPSTDA